MKSILSVALLTATVTTPTWAQSSTIATQVTDRIVVTGSRIERFENDQPPHVQVIRRADAYAVTVTLECDTRDASQRRDELRATLRNLLRASQRNRDFEVGVLVEINDQGAQRIVPFTADMVDTITLRRGSRVETSAVTISLVTPIADEDDFETLSDRTDAFISSVDMVGRTQFGRGRDFNLTVNGGPGRYRNDLLTAIAEDASRTAAYFGDEFTVELQGLEQPVRWQLSEGLSLAIYIDYEMTVRPD